MKVKNTLSQKINLCLPDGKEVVLGKDQTIEMPKWMFETLVIVFPGLKAVKEEVKIAGEPVKIEPKEEPQEEPKVAKNVKGKKSGK